MKYSDYGHIHCHTHASDGDITPELILASGLNLRFVAATDHDSLEGYRRLIALKEFGVLVIPGIEVTVFFKGFKFHVLVLYPNDEIEFLKKIEKIQVQRKNRIDKIIRTLKSNAWILPESFGTKRKLPTKREIFKAVFKYNKGRINRLPHTNEKQFKDAFLDEFSIEAVGLKAAEVLPLAKGIKILAHPAYSVSLSENERIVAQFLEEFKISAIEVVTRKHTHEQIKASYQLAKMTGLIKITSNDVHKREHLFNNQTPLKQLDKLLN